jgi:hypothetical protein
MLENIVLSLFQAVVYTKRNMLIFKLILVVGGSTIV